MSDPEDIKDTKKAAGKPEDIGRRIWLAGLGAYGQSFESVQNSVEKVNNETRDYFEKLVARGEELESHTRKTLHETRDNAMKRANSKIKEHGDRLASQAEKLQKFTLDSLSLDKLKPETHSLENLTEAINGRLDDIRSKINTLVPCMVTRDDLRTLSEKIDKLTTANRSSRANRAKNNAASTHNNADPKTDGASD